MVLCLLNCTGARGLTINELIEPIINITNKQHGAGWTDLQWYLGRETDLSKAYAAARDNVGAATKHLVEVEWDAFSWHQLIYGLVEMEATRLKLLGNYYEMEVGFEKLQKEFLRMKSRANETLHKVMIELAEAKQDNAKLEEVIEANLKTATRKELEAVREKRELMKALEKAYATISQLQEEKRVTDDIMAQITNSSSGIGPAGTDTKTASNSAAKPHCGNRIMGVR